MIFNPVFGAWWIQHFHIDAMHVVYSATGNIEKEMRKRKEPFSNSRRCENLKN